MSKAFTKDDEAAPDVAPALPKVAPGQKRYVTPEGLRALQAELATLGEARRAAAARTGPEAQAELARIDGRIRWISGLVALLTPVEFDRTRGEKAFFGAWVTLEDPDGARVTWRLVGPDEADAKAGLLSVESPLAKATLGREPGDAVIVDRPAGKLEYELVEVRWTPPGS